MKKGVVSPLFAVELEPGKAVRQSLEFVHPFTQAVPLNKTLLKNIAEICDHPDKINEERAMLLTFWQDQADLLQPESLSILDQVKDPYLRRLLRGFPTMSVRNLASSSMWLSGGRWRPRLGPRIKASATKC